jgi:predicted lipoprotein with Yx(FWY)xxD motif
MDREVTVKNTFTLAAAASTLVLLVGCGSSKKSTTSSSNPAAPSTTAASSTSSGGAYGHSSSTSGTTSGSAMTVTSKHGKLGTILAAGPKKLTVYLFEGDKGTTSSNCNGACASAWPPVTTSATAQATAAAKAADLGTITRADGTKQVTYKGHPLYYFSSDKDAGDAYGQGKKAFGADWYVLAPTGNKVDES